MTTPSKVEALVAEFAERIRQAVLEELFESYQSKLVADAPALPAATNKTSVATMKRRKGQKRTPAEIENQLRMVLGFLKKAPGITAITISKGTGIPTGDLALVLQKLKDTKAVKVTGVRRGTRYTLR